MHRAGAPKGIAPDRHAWNTFFFIGMSLEKNRFIIYHHAVFS
jgi:hypothetical protein